MRVWRAGFLVCALLFICAATLTPVRAAMSNKVASSFFCVGCEPLAGVDAILNVVLFVPFGFALALVDIRPGRAFLIGTLVSASIETLQHFGLPGGRVANFTDVITNSIGALVGAAAGSTRKRWVLPNARSAVHLATASAVIVVMIFALTAWALGRDSDAFATARLSRSPLPFTPGFGWYHGYMLDAKVHGDLFDHPGDGPLILQGSLATHDSLRMRIARRDERHELVPFLYVHRANDSLPEIIVGQSGSDARVRVSLRAQRLRLASPDLLLPNLFATATNDIRTLTVLLEPDRLTARAELSGIRTSTTFPLTIGLGWTLIQNVVHLNNEGGFLLTVFWIALLLAPIGYWCAQSDNRFVLGVVCSALVAALLILPRMAGIAPTPNVEWFGAFIGFAIGLGGGVTVSRRSRNR